MTVDQLNAIKRRHKSLTQKQGTDLCRDFEWLISEVERLRLSDTVLRRDVEELRAARIADLEVISDYCKKLAATLNGIDPKNPATESVRRVAQMIATKLGILRERNINGR
jgi:hypothetical protein